MTTDQPLTLPGDVHLIRFLPDSEGPERVARNSLVLRSPSDTVLVDTGAAREGDRWWEQVEAVVDPGDVRWVFLSHEDADHVGNLPEVLDRCPEATIVTSWQLGERLTASQSVPLARCRWLNDGERTTLGARDVVAVRPPAYDSPATRGLYDIGSKAYWAADCFGVPVPHPVDEVGQLDRDVWEDGTLRFASLLSPWTTDVDPRRWRRAVARVASLDIQMIVSAHGPVIHRRDVDHALDLFTELPDRPAEPLPTQRELAALLAATRAA